jgi:hypothetical protein
MGYNLFSILFILYILITNICIPPNAHLLCKIKNCVCVYMNCPFVLKTLMLDVCMHINTYYINRDTAMNFVQDYVNIILSTVSTFLYS